MKTVGIIAEYNPFHNGHRYHIEESRRRTGADCVVAVMSGNFTQRGEAAVLDKWTRACLAVENGVDLVLELPFIFACSRAETFAAGAVDILQAMGVDWISFGSESGDLAQLAELARQMVKQEKEISQKRRDIMKSGCSFAKANELAVQAVLGADKSRLLLAPNNILALEYLKRIFYWQGKGAALMPVTIKRHGSGYLEANERMGFAGAAAIRRMKARDEFAAYVPETVADALAAALESGRTQEHMQAQFFQLLRAELVRSRAEELSRIYCMGEGLENKLKKEIIRVQTFDELLSAVVSRRYTEAAVRRILVYTLLSLKEREPKRNLYARVLALNDMGRNCLRLVKKQKNGQLPVITNINKDAEACIKAGRTLQYDILAADMYHILSDQDLYRFSDKVVRPYVGRGREDAVHAADGSQDM